MVMMQILIGNVESRLNWMFGDTIVQAWIHGPEHRLTNSVFQLINIIDSRNWNASVK